MKKKGLGVGNWNGFGGHVEKGETIKEAAKREVFEEAGINISKIKKLGVINYEFVGSPDILEVHFFKSTSFTGKPAETEEMRPKWFPVDRIPFKKMWPDDKFWMPLFLSNQKFKGRFYFDENNKIVDYELEKITI